MEWLKNLSNAIEYIESHLDTEISYEEVARIACCSTYYFQRCVLTQALLASFYPEMKGASEETVKFHSPAQFVSNFSDSSVSSFAVSCVWCKRVSRISDGQLQ